MEKKKHYIDSPLTQNKNKKKLNTYSILPPYPIGQYIDLDYSIWLWRALTPLIITFLLPLVFVLLIYLSSLFLYIYKLHR